LGEGRVSPTCCHVLGPRHNGGTHPDPGLAGTRERVRKFFGHEDLGASEPSDDERLHCASPCTGAFARARITSGVMPPLVPQASAFSWVRAHDCGCQASSTSISSAVYSMTLPTGSVK